MIDELVEAIVKIGNHKRIIKECEPNIFCPMELKGWMVKRTLYAWRILEDEIYKDTRGAISETPVSSEGSIHSNSECL